jgi:hypothetical protein
MTSHRHGPRRAHARRAALRPRAGDHTPDLAALLAADVIVCTPEKWDGISRNWQARAYVKKVCAAGAALRPAPAAPGGGDRWGGAPCVARDTTHKPHTNHTPTTHQPHTNHARPAQAGDMRDDR